MSDRKNARLEARLPVHVHAAIKRAAELRGGTLTDFVIHALQEAAQRTIEETDIIRLSVEDQVLFAEALIDPSHRGEALRKAARLHSENVESR